MMCLFIQLYIQLIVFKLPFFPNYLIIFPAPQEWPDYVSGWGAAVVNIFVTFPINKTMFRQQVHGVSTINAIKMLKEEGAIYLYRGILPPLLQKSTSTCIMFGTYSHYNRILSDFLGIKNVSYSF